MNTILSNAFQSLIKKAKEQLLLNPSADQVIILQTSLNNIYPLINPNCSCHEEENMFIDMLQNKNETEIKYLVCMWNNCGLDLPSMHFRRTLLAANPKNADTIMLLNGTFKPLLFPLKKSMPPGQ